MSRSFKKTGRRVSPHGLEWRILKQTPMAFVLSGLMIYLITQLAHWSLATDDALRNMKQTEFIEIIAISSLITIWTAIFTVAIGAFVVFIMKGPVYTADSLELIDSEQPAKDNPEQNHRHF